MTKGTGRGEIEFNLGSFTLDDQTVSVGRDNWRSIETAARNHRQLRNVYVSNDGWLHASATEGTMINLTDEKLTSTLRSLERWIKQQAARIEAKSRQTAATS